MALAAQQGLGRADRSDLLDVSMLSVVVPTFDSERALVPTLAMLVPAAMSGIVREVIIADGGSTDATLEVADVADARCSRLGAVGAAAARGRRRGTGALADVPAAGTVLDTTWLDETVQFVEETERGEAVAAAVFRKAVSPRASHRSCSRHSRCSNSPCSAGPARTRDWSSAPASTANSPATATGLPTPKPTSWRASAAAASCCCAAGRAASFLFLASHYCHRPA